MANLLQARSACLAPTSQSLPAAKARQERPGKKRKEKARRPQHRTREARSAQASKRGQGNWAGRERQATTGHELQDREARTAQDKPEEIRLEPKTEKRRTPRRRQEKTHTASNQLKTSFTKFCSQTQDTARTDPELHHAQYLSEEPLRRQVKHHPLHNDPSPPVAPPCTAFPAQS